MVAGGAGSAVLSEEAGETLLALLDRIETLLVAVHTHSVRAADVHLQLGIVGLLFLANVVNTDVVLAVIAPLGMVVGDGDVGNAVTGRNV